VKVESIIAIFTFPFLFAIVTVGCAVLASLLLVVVEGSIRAKF